MFDFPLFPEQASTLADKVDAVYFFALAISAFFSLLIAVFIFFFFVKYRRRQAGEIGEQAHGNTLYLEITWSVIPLIITMVMFFWGALVFIEARKMPEDASEYLATGKQWMWKFQHPEGQREINTLHVPVGERVKLTMTSEDVIHSFYVPAFRVKQDVLPGRYTTVWFEATQVGEFHLFCAEYCGTEHAQMIGKVIVLEQDAYQAWLKGYAGEVKAAKNLGEQLFEQYICNTCHYADGTGRGPSLVGIYGQEVQLVDGSTLTRDDNYLRTSILQPATHVVQGYLQIMPTYQGQISEVALMQLIAYVKSLSPTEDTATEEGAELAATATGAPSTEDQLR